MRWRKDGQLHTARDAGVIADVQTIQRTNLPIDILMTRDTFNKVCQVQPGNLASLLYFPATHTALAMPSIQFTPLAGRSWTGTGCPHPDLLVRMFIDAQSDFIRLTLTLNFQHY
jgi:hypothetical protein